MMPRQIEHIEATHTFCFTTALKGLKNKEIDMATTVEEEPQKIMKLSNTRWLSIANYVSRVLDQYEELKLRF